VPAPIDQFVKAGIRSSRWTIRSGIPRYDARFQQRDLSALGSVIGHEDVALHPGGVDTLPTPSTGYPFALKIPTRPA
jgi:hypothetical protein